MAVEAFGEGFDAVVRQVEQRCADVRVDVEEVLAGRIPFDEVTFAASDPHGPVPEQAEKQQVTLAKGADATEAPEAREPATR